MILASSNLKRFSYDEDSETLTMFFRSGACYVYTGVERDVVSAMKSADSRGRFFYRMIRLKYPYVKMAGPKPELRGKKFFNTSKSSVHQRDRLKNITDVPWQG